ncbi:MAG: Mur ligase family protein [Clostridia bacterium]|jgi:UDP-N-acetylmuramoyl-L-alanyl-D-glutamate--2,6-diaminopimelate ligase|nr:UDP-N-acetylmuramoyl-L-alanyl-D-glutamate--2,6-diaminopimelate ligase [Clostridiales bacterium]
MHLDIDIKGVTCDSRRVKPGFAFVAIRGEKEDGNDYIQEAIAKGASVIYTQDNPEQLPINIPVIRVENPRSVLAKLLSRFYGFPSEKLNMIGVTGTNGKTTTSFMTEFIFRQAGYATGLIGTVMVKAGSNYYPHGLTTPDSECLQKYLAEMAGQKVYAVVMEVSSHGLKYQRVDAIRFNAAVHTNITPDHMDTHSSFQEYVSTKRRLFNMLPPGAAAIINTDDPYGLELVRDNPKLLILTYGLGAKASVTASSIDMNNFGISYTCCLQRSFTNVMGGDVEPQEIPITLTIPGKHNVYNSLAAVTVGLLYGIEPQVIQSALRGFKGVWRRMQVIHREDYIVIDDFSHNPGSYEAAFETVQAMDYNNLYIINAIRGSRGEEINRANASAIANWANLLDAKEILVTSSSDVVDHEDHVTDGEREIFMEELKKADVKTRFFDMLEPAIEEVICKAKTGDTILLMGAQGMNKGQDIFRIKMDRLSRIKRRDITTLPFEYLSNNTTNPS